MNDSSGHQLKEVPTLLGPWFLFPVAAAYILIAVVAAVGNLLVCFAILTNRSLRSKPSNLLPLSLAVSDLLTAVLAMPFDIESLLLQGHWRHGPVMCVTFLTSYLITVPTSILTLLAISLDRYQNLRDPLRRFRLTQFMTRTKALIVIGIIWLYCILFACLPFMGWPFITRGTKKELEQCSISFTVLYNILSNFLNFVGPLVITCVLNIMMYCIACKHNKRGLRNHGKNSKEDAKAHARSLKAARTTVMLVAAFFFCWQPFSYFSIVSILYGEQNWDPYPSKVFYVLLVFGYLNSALNAFFFAFRNKQFKATYVRMFNLSKRCISRVHDFVVSPSFLNDLTSGVPEAENKNVRLQAFRSKRSTPDPPRHQSTST